MLLYSIWGFRWILFSSWIKGEEIRSLVGNVWDVARMRWVIGWLFPELVKSLPVRRTSSEVPRRRCCKGVGFFIYLFLIWM